MSRRWKVGDYAWKQAGAGFVGKASQVFIPDVPENRDPDWDQCCLCDDPECREWPTLWAYDAAGAYLGIACHVSDCQLDEVAAP